MELPFYSDDAKDGWIEVEKDTREIRGVVTPIIQIEVRGEKSVFTTEQAQKIVQALELSIKACDSSYKTREELSSRQQAIDTLKRILATDKNRYQLFQATVAQCFIQCYKEFFAENDYSATSHQDIKAVAEAAAVRYMTKFVFQNDLTDLLEFS